MKKIGLLILLFFFLAPITEAKTVFQQVPNTDLLIYIDDNGVMRNGASEEEAAFFGVNYSTPFAHSYRALKLLGKDHKTAIEQDVYHFARLGLDAFRIHIWDTEISDSLGNLTPNEHLDLFDYMLSKLEERNIKVILTPLTFYDNAYPDGATATVGFANYISKEEAPLNREFYPVIKNYLDQFLNHENPYTGKTYREDPNIIAMEIINEPSHWGEEEPITDFINEMAGHVRDTGWEKPVFYNIAQNPTVVNAVMKAEVDGLSFQWYPAGLVGGEAIQQNYMPYVNDYSVPFRDGEGFSDKAMMVYEFDAADNQHTYSYPLMARSFREAGFQWATQFAYDPLPIAPHNSDYPTHFLNLAYSPKRALSMLIASEVFHQVPRQKSFENFPADTIFSDFRLSHSQNLAELNSEEKFYYTNYTKTEPASLSILKHIAGAGSSPVVQYEGTGAYFLDKIEDGIWRLEVFPDAIPVSDPFEKPNFNKKVTHIFWDERKMNIQLPGLGDDFEVSGLNNGNNKKLNAKDGSFKITPGTYLLTHPSKKLFKVSDGLTVGNHNLKLNEFYAPNPNSYKKPVVVNSPDAYLSSGKTAIIKATVLGIDEKEIRVIAAPYGRQGGNFEMVESAPAVYEAKIPGEFLSSGQLRYWITIGEGENQLTFPGGHSGNPWAWNYYHDEEWTVPVILENIPVQLFSAAGETDQLDFAFSPWSGDYEREISYWENSGEAVVRVFADSLLAANDPLGWSYFAGNKIKNREKTTFESISIKAAGIISQPQTLKVVVADNHGIPFAGEIEITNTQEEVVLKSGDFHPDKMALLPRPYPTFLPYWFEPGIDTELHLADIEVIQVLLLPDDNPGLINNPAGFEVSGIWLNPK